MKAEQMSMFGGPPQLHRDPEPTEREAAAKIAPTVETLRRAVYREVARSPHGLAAFEVCARFPDVTPYSIRPRLTELAGRGLLAKGGRRFNERGNGEVVWHAVNPTQSAGEVTTYGD